MTRGGAELGTILGTAIKRWNNGDYPMEPGEHDRLPIFEGDRVFVDNGHGKRVPVNVWAIAHVSKQLYYGHLSISQISGFKDELSGGVITNAFTTGIFDYEVVLKEWEKIDAVESLPTPPLMVLVGLLGWPEDFDVPDAFGFGR